MRVKTQGCRSVVQVLFRVRQMLAMIEGKFGLGGLGALECIGSLIPHKDIRLCVCVYGGRSTSWSGSADLQ